jgi:EAL domain-containing protein (putative c-di-GMP-specific phosphodiesterase class I)
MVNLINVSFIILLLTIVLMSGVFLILFYKTERSYSYDKNLKKWLKKNQLAFDSIFALLIGVNAKGIYQVSVHKREAENVYKHFNLELERSFGKNSVKRVSYDEFLILTEFPNQIKHCEKRKKGYQKVFCEKVVAFIGNLESEKKLFSSLYPFQISIGCAASGFRYYVDTLEQLVDLAYVTQKEAQRKHLKFLVADEIIRAQKLDVDECKKGFLKAGWQTQFEPFFQPLVAVNNFTIIGFESLARWQIGDFRLLPAHVFKDVATELQHISAIDQIIINKTFLFYKKMMDDNLISTTFKMVLNLSNESLQEGFAQVVYRLTKENKFLPSQIEFDVKDSAFVAKETLKTIKELREYGFKVSLDIFNDTAFDLHTFFRTDFDTIKFDFSTFTFELEQLFVALINIAKQKGVEIVAKGIECKETMEIALALGCNYVQGNYFTVPLDKIKFENYIEKHQKGFYQDLSFG